MVHTKKHYKSKSTKRHHKKNRSYVKRHHIKTQKRRLRGGSKATPLPHYTYSMGNPQQEALQKFNNMNLHQHNLISGNHTLVGGVSDVHTSMTVPQFANAGGFAPSGPVDSTALSLQGNNSHLQRSEQASYDPDVNKLMVNGKLVGGYQYLKINQRKINQKRKQKTSQKQTRKHRK